MFGHERELFLRYVRKQLYELPAADAEDILSEVISSLLSRGNIVEQVENISAYIYRSLYYDCLHKKSFRRTSRRQHRPNSIRRTIAFGSYFIRLLNASKRDLQTAWQRKKGHGCLNAMARLFLGFITFTNHDC